MALDSTSGHEGLGQALVSALQRRSAKDLLNAMNTFRANEQARPGTVRFLISEAASAPLSSRMTAIQVIGSLRLAEAEQTLFEILRTEFPTPVLEEICRSDELRTFRAQLLSKIGMALLQIGSPRSKTVLQDLLRVLEGSRVARVLNKVAAFKR